MDGTRNKRRHLEGTDVISNLPCEIIDYILKYLPFGDAVRTSILSREWRFKWLNVPNLVFDRNLGKVYYRSSQLKSIINRVLFNHKGPIDKFIFNNNYYNHKSHHTMITDWIRYLSYCQIREFSLQLDSIPERFLIPSELFTLKHLTHLTLRGCEFRPSSELRGFPLLVHLKLANVAIVPHEFCSFIAKCPLLEDLSLIKCPGFEGLDFDAPRLKKFYFSGDLSSISLKRTSLIEELFLVLDCLNTRIQLMNSFSQLSSLARLTLISHVQLLIEDGVPEKLPHNLNHLKEVYLGDISLDHTLEVKFVVCLLRSSPNLERLSISFLKDGDCEDSRQFLKSQERRNMISLNHLKDVFIEWWFMDTIADLEMKFVKLILASAAELETLEIQFRTCSDIKTQSQIQKKLARFLPPSLKTNIKFKRNLIFGN